MTDVSFSFYFVRHHKQTQKNIDDFWKRITCHKYNGVKMDLNNDSESTTVQDTIIQNMLFMNRPPNAK